VRAVSGRPRYAADEQIFDAVVWIMHHLKVVPEGARGVPVGALLQA
jgi:hypothetical protein